MNRYAKEFQLKFDEINALVRESYESAAGNAEQVVDDITSILINGYMLGVEHCCDMLGIERVGKKKRPDEEGEEDDYEDLYLDGLADGYGVIKELPQMRLNDAQISLFIRTGILPMEFAKQNHNRHTLTEKDLDDLEEAMYVMYDGKTFEDRVIEYVEKEDIDGIRVVAETEYHRVYNTGSHNVAKSVDGDLKKTWLTELDDKVRETHQMLESVTVGVDEKFYTIDGDEAMYPGTFKNASNNVNCRCILEYEYCQ